MEKKGEDLREGLRSTLDQLHKKASSVLSLTRRWKEFEDQYQSEMNSIEDRAREVRSIEEAVVKRHRELDAKEEELRAIAETLEARLKEIAEREEEVVCQKKMLFEQQDEHCEWYGERLKKVESDRKSIEEKFHEMRAIEKCVEHYWEAIKDETFSNVSSWERRLEQRLQMFELRKRRHSSEMNKRWRAINRKEKQLEELSMELQQRQKELKTSSKGLEQKTKESRSQVLENLSGNNVRNPRFSHVSSRERRLELGLKGFELRKRRHSREMNKRKKALAARELQLEERSKELERREKELKTSLEGLEQKRKESRSQVLENLSGNKHPRTEPESAMNSSPSNKDNNGDDYLEPPSKKSKGDANVASSELNAKVDKASVSDTNDDIIEVPDSDFTNFDEQKAENSFSAHQVWALYDPRDGMPRFYARVNKILLSPDFTVQITWLEPSPDNEDEQEWDEAELPIGCGKFENGETVETSDRLMFSHKMNCIKGSRKGTWLVQPNVGEIWAIFKDWSMDWKSEPEKNKGPYDFDYVKVLGRDDRRGGIEVVCLSGVAGFTSIYELPAEIEGKGDGSTLCIPRGEMCRFSHRIPARRMTGKEAPGVPVGSFELDTAALAYGLRDLKWD